MIEDFQDNSKDRSSRILFNEISYEWRRAGHQEVFRWSVHVIPCGFAQKYVEFHTFPISYMDPHRISWTYAENTTCFVTGYSENTELFRFPHISTVFDVDFHVDFKRKKIPDGGDILQRNETKNREYYYVKY
ncbi:unnamed protein product [Rhizophagus irregularis]|nr:unnamed protein product [Rhizophagus irregularis]